LEVAQYVPEPFFDPLNDLVCRGLDRERLYWLRRFDPPELFSHSFYGKPIIIEQLLNLKNQFQVLSYIHPLSRLIFSRL